MDEGEGPGCVVGGEGELGGGGGGVRRRQRSGGEGLGVVAVVVSLPGNRRESRESEGRE